MEISLKPREVIERVRYLADLSTKPKQFQQQNKQSYKHKKYIRMTKSLSSSKDAVTKQKVMAYVLKNLGIFLIIFEENHTYTIQNSKRS